mgnify:CR=1 FL=1
MSTVDTSNSSAWSQTLSSLSGAMSSYLQDKMHKKMDADGDGGVSQSEFQAALEKVAGKLGVEVGQGASELYASLDANKDGALNGAEVGTLLQNLFSSASNTQAFVQQRVETFVGIGGALQVAKGQGAFGQALEGDEVEPATFGQVAGGGDAVAGKTGARANAQGHGASSGCAYGGMHRHCACPPRMSKKHWRSA